MLVVRNTFRLRFGKAKDAIAVAKDMVSLNAKAGFSDTRLLVDLVTDHYTLVLEIMVDSLADLETRMAQLMGHPDWQACYARFVPLVESGRREIFRVV